MAFNSDIAHHGCGPGKLTSALLRKQRDQTLAITSAPTIQIFQWMLDTRPLWPIRATATSKGQIEEFKTVVGLASLSS